MTKNKKQKLAIKAIAALAMAELLWGLNKPIIKLGLQTIPLSLYLSVTIIGTALLILPLALRNWKRLQTQDYLILVIGSIIAITIGNVALLMGLQRVSAINASLIGLFGPLLLFVFSIQFLKEKLSVRTLLGILIAFGGAAIIVGKPWEIQGSDNTAAIGNLLIILAVISSIVGTLITKSTLKKGGLYQVTFIYLMAGILPVALFTIKDINALAPSQAGSSGYVAIAVNIVAITLANCFFMYGLKYRKAQEVGVFSYISPIATMVSAWLILDERLTAKIAAGALLIFIGIYLATIKEMPVKTTYKHRAAKHIRV